MAAPRPVRVVIVQVSGAIADIVFDAGPIVPADLSRAEAMALLRALAEQYPAHVVVAADEVRQRTTEPELQSWRHPDDVESRLLDTAAIEQAWISSRYWGDSIEASNILGKRIEPLRSVELIQQAKQVEEAETGRPALLGGGRPGLQ
jgi:hypothetical protein